MGTSAKRSDPQLWERVKQEITASAKGGHPGQWSARKAQLAVQAYKSAGGRYEGKQATDNSLKQWQEEDWGTKSGAKSTDTGERYLPRKAREAISDRDYRRTSDKKRADSAKGRQFSRQPEDIAAATAKKRGHGTGPTRKELYDLAKRRGLPGRSRLTKAELAKALR